MRTTLSGRNMAGQRSVRHHSTGNHSRRIPLRTLLEATRKFKDHPALKFFFIGGGLGKKEVEAFARDNAIANIVCLPYSRWPTSAIRSPRRIVVSLGDDVVGIVHPCKIYGAMTVGRPILFLGPAHPTWRTSLDETPHRPAHRPRGRRCGRRGDPSLPRRPAGGVGPSWPNRSAGVDATLHAGLPMRQVLRRAGAGIGLCPGPACCQVILKEFRQCLAECSSRCRVLACRFLPSLVRRTSTKSAAISGRSRRGRDRPTPALDKSRRPVNRSSQRFQICLSERPDVIDHRVKLVIGAPCDTPPAACAGAGTPS